MTDGNMNTGTKAVGFTLMGSELVAMISVLPLKRSWCLVDLCIFCIFVLIIELKTVTYG